MMARMQEYDSETALIVVDVQNDFADPAGSLYVAGGEQIVDPINQEIWAARDAGALVVYTQDWHPETTPHFAKDGGIWPVHCVQNTWGAEFHPALDVQGEVLRKGTEGEDGYSGFTVRDPASGDTHGTRLESMLRSRGVEHNVIVGLATDYCVKDTAIDSAQKGFRTTVLKGVIRAVNLEPDDGSNALQAMSSAGADLV
jgi:nicotinamidase/pyrazinamidase